MRRPSYRSSQGVGDLTYISELISESKLGETGKLFIVHPQGQFVSHSRLMELLKKGTSKVPYFEKIQPREAYTGVYKDYTGNEVLGSWKWIPSLRCYLIAEQETKEAFYEINLLVKNAIIIFIISTIFILGISYWVIGSATAPIKRLSEAVASIRGGSFWENRFDQERRMKSANWSSVLTSWPRN